MTDNFITVNNIKLHYVEEGAGELVILLHGFPEFWYSWRKQIPVLSKSYRVVAPDMRGYNLSDKPAEVIDYRIDRLATDIKELIIALGEQKAIVVGHDWGAAVAWAVASLYPEVVSKLAILNVPHPSEMKKAFMGFNIRQLFRSYYMFFFQLPVIPEKMMGRNLHKFFKQVFIGLGPKNGTGKIPAEEIEKYVQAFSQPGALTGAINYYRAAIRNMNYSIQRKEKLPMPVLMLWGEQDKALGKELTYNTAEYCSKLDIIYDAESGHFIQQNNPELVNTKLLEFFKKND
jgi:pimeloyl-ACP methyl ester carboxylesterase